MIKRYNIQTVRKYTNKEGELKNQYLNVGTLVQFEPNEKGDGGFAIELNMFPETKFHVYEKEDRKKSEPIEDNSVPF